MVCVIIVLYNGLYRQWIDQCFSSLRKSKEPLSVIAIDNGSSDGSIAFVREKYPEVQLFVSSKNLGFGGANNWGMSEALAQSADFVFLLNQDAWINEDTISLMLAYAKTNPQFGVLSPIQLNGIGTALDYNFSNYINPECCNGFYSDAVLGKVEDKVYPVDFVCAAAWLISKSCLKLVGGFSPTFFHYGEDDNYCQRVLYKGLKVGIVPKAYIYHDREDRGAFDRKNIDVNWGYNRLKIRASDPSRDEFKAIYNENRKGVLRAFLTGQFEEAKRYTSYLKLLSEDRQKIIENRSDSISGRPYLFLTYDI